MEAGQLLVVGKAAVRSLLPMRKCVDALEQAFLALAEQRARQDGGPEFVQQPVRSKLWAKDGEGLIQMPCFLSAKGATEGAPRKEMLGTKVLSYFATNAGTPYAVVQGCVLVFDAANGAVRAIIEASEVTAIRTASTSGLATQLLCRDTSDLVCTIVGAGKEAHTHIAAMHAVRDIKKFMVWCRSPEKGQKFVEEQLGLWADARFSIEYCANLQAACEAADIICTVTSATEPVVRGEWLKAGTHVNAIGAFQPHTRELDTDVIRKARVFCEEWDAAWSEAGDLIIPVEEGAVGKEHVLADLADLASKRVAGRTSDADVTVFKGTGVSLEDMAAAQAILDAAVDSGGGQWVEF
mmetsp:Transcript_957/g.2292  ORF Transcript_957/g.2292 Transcript_957/m.2292 type:complete len:352 (+) Transcript_957:35-1090(+)